MLLFFFFSRGKTRSQKVSRSSVRVPRWSAWRSYQLVRIIFGWPVFSHGGTGLSISVLTPEFFFSFAQMMDSTRSSVTSKPRPLPSKWDHARKPWRSTLWVSACCDPHFPDVWCFVYLQEQQAWPSICVLWFWSLRSTSTSAWSVDGAMRRTGFCCVTAVTTATTPSAWSRLYRTCPKETGAAQSVLLRYGLNTVDL